MAAGRAATAMLKKAGFTRASGMRILATTNTTNNTVLINTLINNEFAKEGSAC
jgi:hypothetical protein